MLPLSVLLDVFESHGAGREVSQNLRAGAITAFRVGERGLHRLLVLALHTFPLLLRRFALHLRS
jgi:hypothetical protein